MSAVAGRVLLQAPYPVVHSSSHQSLSSMHHPAAQTPPALGRPSSAFNPPPPLASSSSHNSLFSLNAHSRQPSSSDLQSSPGGSSTSPMSVQKMHTIHALQNPGAGHEAEVHYPCTADDYDIVAEIGIGAFATVYRATVTATGEEVAIKIIDLEQFNTNWYTNPHPRAPTLTPRTHPQTHPSPS